MLATDSILRRISFNSIKKLKIEKSK